MGKLTLLSSYWNIILSLRIHSMKISFRSFTLNLWSVFEFLVCSNVLAYVTLPWVLEWFLIPTLQRATEPWREGEGHTALAPRLDFVLFAAVFAQCLVSALGGADTSLWVLAGNPPSCHWRAASRPGSGSSAPRAPSVTLVTLIESLLCCLILVSPPFLLHY